MQVKVPSLMIAGVTSGVGKTLISIGLMYLLKKRGFKVQPFKVGPDYIDPGHHSKILKVISRNLDGWMIDKDILTYLYLKHALKSDIAIVEGVMGFYDGYKATDLGSSAYISKILKIPVILVLNAEKTSRSAAAVIYGFKHFDKDVNICGVILNKVGSNFHYNLLKKSIEEEAKVKVLGYLPKDENLLLPERHLGLVTAEELLLSEKFLDYLKDLMEKHLDIEAILDIATKKSGKLKQIKLNIPENKKDIKIAVAKDEAFCFYYYDNFELLESFGGEIVFFSPLRDKKLPRGISAIYIGGGYPEEFAEKLSENFSLKKEIKNFAESGYPIYAECGGFMYLTEGIFDFKNNFYPMVGIFKTKVRMLKKRKALGYVEIFLKENCILGSSKMRLKGHEFHYSEILHTPTNAKTVYIVKKDNEKEEGYLYSRVLGSYIHIHFGSNISSVEHFLNFCRKCK